MKETTTFKDREANFRLRRIEGRHNALVKELRRAFTRGELTPDGYCAIEGLRILEKAIRSGLRFPAVFFNEPAAPPPAPLHPHLTPPPKTLHHPHKPFPT